MDKTSATSSAPRIGTNICYRPIKTKHLLTMALRSRGKRGELSRLLDECIIGHLGPKYPKLLADIKAADRVFGNADEKKAA